MRLLSDLWKWVPLACGLRDFLRHTLTPEEARAIVSRRLAQREDNFVRLVEKGIFGHEKSPYRPLLKLAGCTREDIRNMVRDRGLESTLRVLREEGVYVTFEEVRGRTPIVRHGREIPTRPEDFDNPHLKHFYYGESSGSSSTPSRTPIDLDHLAAETAPILLAWQAYGILDWPKAIWRGILPDASGLNYVLRGAKLGHIPEAWFTHIVAKDTKGSWKALAATYGVLGLSRIYGTRLPRPVPARVQEGQVVARWAGEMVSKHGRCAILTQVSRAVRAAIAARDRGIDLKGTVVVVGGEPPTPAKINEITKSGAKHLPLYHVSEAGQIGNGCCNPADGNDIHFFSDCYGLIQHPREVAGTDISVNAFNLTTLLPSTPKIMLNVECDDYGTLDERSCGCPLEGYGYTQHIRDIRSFSKLTGEGVTIVGSDMVRILEEVLPARFGGSPLDYQLVEDESEEGLTSLVLFVSPQVPLRGEKEVVETVLAALGRVDAGTDQARAIWAQAGTLRVKRAEPVWTNRGKLMPLHLAGRGRRRSSPN